MQATSHYQNQWSYSLLTHICVTRSQRVNRECRLETVILVPNFEKKSMQLKCVAGSWQEWNSARMITAPTMTAHDGHPPKRSEIAINDHNWNSQDLGRPQTRAPTELKYHPLKRQPTGTAMERNRYKLEGLHTLFGPESIYFILCHIAIIIFHKWHWWYNLIKFELWTFSDNVKYECILSNGVLGCLEIENLHIYF